MSLILDALRRADSERERERGAVPGLHAQQVPAHTPAAAPRARAWPWFWLVLITATGLTAALAAWMIIGREAPRQSAVSMAAQPDAAASSVAAAAGDPSPAAAAVAPTAASPGARAIPPQPQPVAEPAPWLAQEPARRPPTAGIAAVPAGRGPEAKAVQSAPSAAAEVPIALRSQLPENIRAQLPPLAVGGSIYSASAPDRSVIIDGRILRENDRLTADLTLEQIRPRSAVLSYRGHRFEIGF